MTKFTKITIVIGFISFGHIWAQDLSQLNGILQQQVAPTTGTTVKAPSISVNSLQDGVKGQIGVATKENLGNINSPSKELDESTSNRLLDNNQQLEIRSQLQTFITETTGKKLDLYGYSVFKRDAYTPITQIPAPVNYVIGPGDELDIKVWGSIDFNIRQVVDRDGKITLPQLGSFGLSGIRVEKLDETLKKQIGRFYKGFEVSGTLSKLRSIQIYVVGNAKKPGAYTVSGMSTLVSAIFESNGPSQHGSLRKIRLIRDGKEISQIDLYEFMKNGESSGNVKLMSGDLIQIPAVGKRVALLGAIDGQAIYELKDKDDTLGGLLNFIGEENTLISHKKVIIERIIKDSENSNRSIEEIAFDNDGLKTNLKDGDLITLQTINSQYSNAVTLRGNVAHPLRYKFKLGMKVSDLIPEVDALIQEDYYIKKNLNVMFNKGDGKDSDFKNSLNQINWEYAVIERLDKDNIKLNIIPFNLGKAIKDKDPLHNLELVSGDVVVIFSDKDIQLPQAKRNIFVKISGEVNAPGLYQVNRNEKLSDLISKSGGLTNDAYIYGTNFTRETTKKLQQENINKIINRVESDINSMSTAALQNSTSQEAIILSQQQLSSQKGFLSKLKNLKANGRISLELTPNDLKFPDVFLESGDDIYIPSTPSFIGVFGSVFSESTYIYRPYTSVKDYLSKAGLSKESDINSVIVIRADGSIDSDSKISGFFSRSVIDMKLYPGDTIFVPEVFDRRNSYAQFIQGAKDWTAILYQFGIGAAAWKTLK